MKVTDKIRLQLSDGCATVEPGSRVVQGTDRNGSRSSSETNTEMVRLLEALGHVVGRQIATSVWVAVRVKALTRPTV